MTNDVLQELNRLMGENAQLEREAVEHEQVARAKRAKYMENKQRLAELRAVINDSKLVHAAQGAFSQAKAARQEAEQAKTEAAAVLDQLKQQQAELAELLREAKRRENEVV